MVLRTVALAVAITVGQTALTAALRGQPTPLTAWPALFQHDGGWCWKWPFNRPTTSFHWHSWPFHKTCRSSFVEPRNLRDDLRARTGLPLPHLSMGMSNDFEVAIEEGATHVRLGGVLFDGLGGRPFHPNCFSPSSITSVSSGGGLPNLAANSSRVGTSRTFIFDS